MLQSLAEYRIMYFAPPLDESVRLDTLYAWLAVVTRVYVHSQPCKLDLQLIWLLVVAYLAYIVSQVISVNLEGCQTAALCM